MVLIKSALVCSLLSLLFAFSPSKAFASASDLSLPVADTGQQFVIYVDTYGIYNYVEFSTVETNFKLVADGSEYLGLSADNISGTYYRLDPVGTYFPINEWQEQGVWTTSAITSFSDIVTTKDLQYSGITRTASGYEPDLTVNDLDIVALTNYPVIPEGTPIVYNDPLLSTESVTTGVAGLTSQIPVGLVAGVGVAGLLFSLKFIIPFFKGFIK